MERTDRCLFDEGFEHVVSQIYLNDKDSWDERQWKNLIMDMKKRRNVGLRPAHHGPGLSAWKRIITVEPVRKYMSMRYGCYPVADSRE